MGGVVMSWVRYLKFAVIVCVGGSLALVEGLAQHRQLVAQTTSGNENQLPEAIDQPNEVPRPASDRAAQLKGTDAVTSGDEAVALSTRPRGDADALVTRPEPMPDALFLPSADRLSLLDR